MRELIERLEHLCEARVSDPKQIAALYDEVKRLAEAVGKRGGKLPSGMRLPNVLGWLRRLPGQSYHRQSGDKPPAQNEIDTNVHQLQVWKRQLERKHARLD